MKTYENYNKEAGNVLFLILIAVILFAALSYAVTSSTRQPQSTIGEATSIAAAQITQYPSGLRTAMLRMMISGVSAESLEFNAPSDFVSLTNSERGIFHPNGGGAVYQTVPVNIMENGTQGVWHFNAEFEIDNIGAETASSFEGNDITAFLPGISYEVCLHLNKRHGIGSTIPNSSADLSGKYLIDMDDSYTLPSEETILGTAGSNGTDALTGQPFGCFQNNSSEYVYYHALVER